MDMEKYLKIAELRDKRVLRELCPVPTSDYKGTEYYHFAVLEPALLPEEFREEYAELGEIRV